MEYANSILAVNVDADIDHETPEPLSPNPLDLDHSYGRSCNQSNLQEARGLYNENMVV